MSAVLKDAALVIGVAAIAVISAGTLAAPGSALAAGLTTTAATVGSAVGVAGLTVAGLGTALGLAAAGIGALATLTAKKPASAAVSPMAWQSDPNAGIPYVMGRMYVGGQIVYRKAWEKHDTNETIITAISAGPVQSFEGMYVDGVLTGYTNGGVADITDRGKFYVSTQRGLQPEASQLGSLGPPGLTSASKLSGLAATSITLIYDAKGGTTFTTEPQIGWVVNGVSTYDPRLDSTYPGGTGPQRINDETTWTQGGKNPYLHALAWLIGRRQNGKLVAGVGAAVASILIPQFVEGANIADANGWVIAGTANTTDDKWSTLKNILQAGGGQPLRLGAQIGCIINTPRVSLTSIGIDDVIGEGSTQATQARRDRLNAIVPRYMAEQSETAQGGDGNLVTTVTWGMVAGSPVVVDDYVAFDGGQRQKQIDYSFVPALTQSQQLARYDIENAREFGPITLPLKLRWMGYKPGDVVTANLPEYGLNGQDILILSRELAPESGTVTMTARSETAGKHAFALGQTGTAPATPSVTGPALIPVPGNTAWAIVAETLTAEGTTIPALCIAGSADSGAVDAVVFEYRESATGEDDGLGWLAAGIEAPSTAGKNITGVKDGTTYECAVSYRKGANTGARLVLGPVIAGQTSVPWQTGVTGPNKPADNATNSADPASPFGDAGKTVADALNLIDQSRTDLATFQSDIDQITADTAAASATADAASQKASSALSSSLDGALNANSVFADWPSDQAAPTEWLAPTGARQSGLASPNAVQLTGGQELSIQNQVRLVDGAQVVLELDVRATGPLTDMTLGLQANLDDVSQHVQGWGYYLGTTAPIDHNGTAVPTAANGESFRFRIYLDARHVGARYYRLYLDVATGSSLVATVDRLCLRLASAAEIAGQQASVDVEAASAAITEEQTTRANADAAMASDIETLEAQAAGTADSWLKAQIIENAQVAADATTAVATRTTTVEAQLAGSTESGLSDQIASKASSTDLTAAIATEQEARAGQYQDLTASLGSQSAEIQNLQEIVVTPAGGAVAKAILQLDSNRHIVGQYITDDGTTGDLVFSFDHVTFLLPDGTPLLVLGGSYGAYAPKLFVGNLTTNTANTPVISTSTTPTRGTSSATSTSGLTPSITLFSKSITLQADGVVEVTASVLQSFTDGVFTNRPYVYGIYVNGNLLPESTRSGTTPGDEVNPVGVFQATADTAYTIELRWNAHTTIEARGRSLIAIGLPATAAPDDTGDGGNYTPTGGSGGTGGGGSGGGGWQKSPYPPE